MTSLPPRGPLRPALLGAALATALFAAAMTSQIVRRSALTMDEIHTLLLGISWARGDVLPFYVGSVTRYEGGSWLIAWPTSWLLRLGASGTAATSWTAGVISLGTVALAGFWTARLRGWAAGAAVGLLAACVPELVHYSYRAWGSICEALIGLPLLALAYEGWLRRGRSLLGALGLGLLLAGCIVLSYVHMVTALAFVLVHLWEARTRRRVTEVTAVALAASAGFLAWVAAVLPFWNEAGIIRDGRSLGSLFGALLFPRLDRVLGSLPAAFVGQLLEPTPLRLLAGGALSLLTVGAAVSAWRSDDPRRRWPLAFLAVFLPALSVGHALQGAPGVYRYYLPLFAVAVALIALWDSRAVGAAALCGLAFWLPSGLPMPYQNPTLNYLELGGNAMHRFHLQPHIKFVALREVVPLWYRPWFAFGYGVDAGQRFSRARKGMEQTLSGRGDPDIEYRGLPHFSLWPLGSWVDFWDGLHAPSDRREYLLGFGIGFCSDARLDARERELLESLSASQRALVLQGFGAAVLRGLDAAPPVDFSGWDEGLGELPWSDYEALGLGMARVQARGMPEGSGLGLRAEAAAALRRGQQGEVDRAWRAMASVPLIATPERLTDEERADP